MNLPPRYQSECRCICHLPGNESIRHVVACCQPDPVEEPAPQFTFHEEWFEKAAQLEGQANVAAGTLADIRFALCEKRELRSAKVAEVQCQAQVWVDAATARLVRLLDLDSEADQRRQFHLAVVYLTAFIPALVAAFHEDLR